MIPNTKENGWFVLYHLYSTSLNYDSQGIKDFHHDLKIAKRWGIKYVVIEDYYRNFCWGEYTCPWNKETFKAIIELIHNEGLDFIPYTNPTEVATHSKIFKKYPQWMVRDRGGKTFTGFLSVFFPRYYREFDFQLKLICPASNWKDCYLEQCRELLDEYGADGIYMDRVDHRIKCSAHPNFEEGIVKIVKRVKEVVKERNKRLIINDCGMFLDKTMRKVLRMADVILIELLPAGRLTHLLKFILYDWGDYLYKMRKILSPLMDFLNKGAYLTSPQLASSKAILKRISKIREVSSSPLLLFTHRATPQGLNLISEVAEQEEGVSFCLFQPEKLKGKGEGIKRLSPLA